LVRLKVEYTGFELSRLKWLETRFEGKIANPKKIFLFWKRKVISVKAGEQ
jgi:double-strand break repair protein MRE11